MEEARCQIGYHWTLLTGFMFSMLPILLSFIFGGRYLFLSCYKCHGILQITIKAMQIKLEQNRTPPVTGQNVSLTGWNLEFLKNDGRWDPIPQERPEWCQCNCWEQGLLTQERSAEGERGSSKHAEVGTTFLFSSLNPIHQRAVSLPSVCYLCPNLVLPAQMTSLKVFLIYHIWCPCWLNSDS